MESTAGGSAVREIVAHAWFTMGFTPARSLVLVQLQPTQGGEVPGFVARVDLPPPRHREIAIGSLVTAARRNGVSAAFVIVALEAGEGRADVARPMTGLVRDLRTRLRRAGVSTVDVVVVDHGRYRSLLCRDDACCPPGGHDLGDLSTTRTAAAMVLAGRTVVADEAQLVADVAPDPWPASVLEEAVPAADAAGASPLELLERWERLLTERLSAGHGGPGRGDGDVDGRRNADPEPETVAWLVPALEDVHVRDALLVDLLPGGGRLARRMARGETDGGQGLGAAQTRRPDLVRFDAARALLAAVVRGAPAGSRGEALAVLAWMSWWCNHAVRARMLAAAAIRDRPGHRLAGLVDTLLLHGVPPRWLVANGVAVPPPVGRSVAGG